MVDIRLVRDFMAVIDYEVVIKPGQGQIRALHNTQGQVTLKGCSPLDTPLQPRKPRLLWGG